MRAILIDQSITHRDEHSLQLYLNELEGMELISAEEEVALAKKIKMGDEAALQKLVRANLRFVVSCAKKYQRLGMPLADLVSEGNLGLIKAAKLFDESRGFKFISYAVWWIRQAMMSALSQHARMIRLPGNMVKATADIRRATEQLEQRLERMPTEEELREVLHVPGDGLAFEYAHGRTVGSLDEQIKSDGADALWTIIPETNTPETDFSLVEAGKAAQLRGVLEILNEKERKILLEWFGFDRDVPRNLEEIAVDLDVTRERVRQMKNDAIAKLKSRLGHKEFLYA